jgi:hypothetical protein
LIARPNSGGPPTRYTRAWPNRAGRPATTRPTTTQPMQKEPARWQSCKRDPKLNLFYASAEHTIHIVWLNVKRSPTFPFLSTRKSPTSPLLAGAAPGGTGRSRRPPRVPTDLASRPTYISSSNAYTRWRYGGSWARGTSDNDELPCTTVAL